MKIDGHGGGNVDRLGLSEILQSRAAGRARSTV